MRNRFFSFALVMLFSIACSSNLFSQSRELDELLNMSLAELTSIQIITASKTPQRIQEVPATVRIITSEEIRNRGYFTLEEALSDLPGMQFRNINGINSYVFMRGVPSQNNLILVLIDGVQINELNSGGFYGGAQYNLSNVDRIEIVCGPASALYGTNAISGIINIITKTPDQQTGLDLHALCGTFNTFKTDLSYGCWDAQKKAGVRISGMVKTSEKADLAGEAGDNNWTRDLDTSEDDYSLDARIKWQTFNFGWNYLNKQASAATYNKSVGTIYRDAGTFWNIRFMNAYLKHDAHPGEKTGISSQIYYRNATVLDNSVLVVTDTAQVGHYRPNDLLGFESLVNHSPGKRINLIAGIVYENENLAQGYSRTYSAAWNIKPPTPQKPAMKRNTLLSFYGQFRVVPVQNIELYAGARFDNSSVYNQVLTPRMGLVFNADRLTAKLLYTEAFRAPKPWDYTDGAGNPNLEPEEMGSMEFCAGYLFMSALRLDVSIFNNRLTNLFMKELLADSWRWINHGELSTTGCEVSLSYRKRAIQSCVNYAFNHSTDENGVMIPEISEHQMNVGLECAFSGRLRCNIRANYTGKRKNTRIVATTGSGYIDAAFIVHSAITWVLYPHLDIQVAVKNLFDAEYYHTSNLMPDRYRQPQRTLLLQADYHLK